MRAFVAVMLPGPTIEALEAGLRELRSQGETAGTVAWVPPERWHLTLAFLGEIDERTADAVASGLLSAASRTETVDLSTRGLGHFGRRTLFARVTGDSGGLHGLAGRCRAVAMKAGVPSGEQRFHPHVTVARAWGRADVRPFVVAGRTLAVPPFTVADVSLVRSILGEGRRYDVLASFRLAADV
jgi:2'-5' RNA ligase